MRDAGSEGEVLLLGLMLLPTCFPQHCLAGVDRLLCDRGWRAGWVRGRGLKLSPATAVGFKQALSLGLILPDTPLKKLFLREVCILL